MHDNEPDLSPLTNLERRLRRNPHRRTVDQWMAEADAATAREQALFEAKWRAVWRDLEARLTALLQDIAAQQARQR